MQVSPTVDGHVASRPFALTLAERRFWLSHQLHAAPVANLARVVQLRGPVDARRWSRAFDALAAAPALRMRIATDDGAPVAMLGAPAALVIDEHADEADVAAAVADVLNTPYDLARGPLLRGRLLRLAAGEWRLVLGAHHLALDGWAFSRAVSRTLATALRGEGPAWDVEAWLAARAARIAAEPASPTGPAADFWRTRLRGASTLALPTTLPSTHSTGRAIDAEVALPPSLLAAVEKSAEQLGCRAVHRLLAATAAEFARAARTDDVVMATTRAELLVDDDTLDARSLGCFVRTRPLRLGVPGSATITEATLEARRAVRESLEHPGVDVEDLGALGDDVPAAAVLFNFLPVKAFDDDFGDVAVAAGRILSGGTGMRAAVTFDVGETEPRIVVEMDADAFDAGAPARLAERLVVALEKGVAAPATPVARIPRLVAADHAALATLQGPAAARAAVVGGTLDRLLVADLDVDDDHPPALVHGDVVVSRRALLAEGRRIAAALRTRGAGPGRFVFVHTHDPLCTVRAILGVLLAGAAYVPLDPALPPARITAKEEAARPVTTLGDDDVRAILAATTSGDAGDAQAEGPAPGGRDPAYVIFTSGSTGTPKGVVIAHDAVVAQLQARTALGFDRVERSLLLAPFFFDGSIETLFWSLTTGGTMQVLDEQQRKDPLLIRRVLRERRITYTSAVPALWSAVLDVDDQPLPDLRFVIVGGEALTATLVEKHRRCAPHARLVNEYGPTESTVFSTAWEVPAGPVDAIPIGTAAPHVTCMVLPEGAGPGDEALPIGEPGELVVSGIGVADGYLNAPARTAEVFVDDLVRPGERAYRTGDVVRLRADGNLEWLGRRDHQVKLRGVRIEMGEVEAALAALPHVDEVAAVVHGGALIGYVAPGPVDEAKALRKLGERLMEAMVPARLIVLPTLPKTANDKIDRKALPAPPADDSFVPPQPGLEQLIADVWRDVLGVERVSVTRSFFAYGGHSLKAAVVVARLKAALGRDVPLSLLMTARTVRALAEALGSSTTGSPSPASPASPAGAPPSTTTPGAHGAPAPSTASSATPSLLLPLHEPDVVATGPGVVFLPGVGGHVFTFAPIAARLGRPAWGLRTLGAEAGEEPLGSIEDMAARNIDELGRHGLVDVVLAGYSMGARVAFEMCRQMQARGKPPRHLVIFDAFAPGYPKPLPAWHRAVLHVADFAERDGRGKLAYVKDRVASLTQKRAFSRGDADAFADLPELHALDPIRRAALQRLHGIGTLADHRYAPEGTIDVPTTVFAAADGIRWVATRTDDALLGWAERIAAMTTRVPLQGNHLGLFRDENLDRMAAVLRGLLTEGRSNGSPR